MDLSDIDIGQVLLDARHRWLKPIEVCNILKNYQQYEFQLNGEPPVKPPGGSLFLFDRKVVRYFRKDGHNWRKKKDGKTVREAHEKLKAGSVDVLHCYYAHSEVDERFQRRCYWLLDEQNENIVLVHYREVPEGSGRISRRSDKERGTAAESPAASQSQAWSQVPGAESPGQSAAVGSQLFQGFPQQQHQQQQQQQLTHHQQLQLAAGALSLAGVQLTPEQQALLAPALLSAQLGSSSGNSLSIKQDHSMEQDSGARDSWFSSASEHSDSQGSGRSTPAVPRGRSTPAVSSGRGPVSTGIPEALSYQSQQHLQQQQLYQQMQDQAVSMNAPSPQVSTGPVSMSTGHVSGVAHEADDYEAYDDGEGDEPEGDDPDDDSTWGESRRQPPARAGSGHQDVAGVLPEGFTTHRVPPTQQHPVHQTQNLIPTPIPQQPLDSHAATPPGVPPGGSPDLGLGLEIGISIPVKSVQDKVQKWTTQPESSSARNLAAAMRGLHEIHPSPRSNSTKSVNQDEPAAPPAAAGVPQSMPGSLGFLTSSPSTGGVPGLPRPTTPGGSSLPPKSGASPLGRALLPPPRPLPEDSAMTDTLMLAPSTGNTLPLQQTNSQEREGQVASAISPVNHIWADLFPKDDSTKSTRSEMKEFKRLNSFDGPNSWLYPRSGSKDPFPKDGSTKSFPKDDSTKSQFKEFKKLGSFDSPEFWNYPGDVVMGQGGQEALDLLEPAEGGSGHMGRTISVSTGMHSSVLFTVADYSPIIAPLRGGLKLLLVGTVCNSSGISTRNIAWGCRFGDIDVPANEVMPGVLRCTVPAQRHPGQVVLTVTCSTSTSDGTVSLADHVPCSTGVPFSYSAESGVDSQSTPEQASVRGLCSLQEWQLQLMLLGHIASTEKTRVSHGDTWAIHQPHSSSSSRAWVAQALLAAEAAAATTSQGTGPHATSSQDPSNRAAVQAAFSGVALETILRYQLPEWLREGGAGAAGGICLEVSESLMKCVGVCLKPGETCEGNCSLHPLEHIQGGGSEWGSQGVMGLRLLHVLAGLGWTWALQALVQAGMPEKEVDATDALCCTPLHWAAAFGRENMVVALLDCGASPSAMSAPVPVGPRLEVFTPADLAESHGHKGIAAYLAEALLKSSLSKLSLQEPGKAGPAIPQHAIISFPKSDTVQSAGDMAVAAAEQAAIARGISEKGVAALEDTLDAVRRAAEAQVLILQHRERMVKQRMGGANEGSSFQQQMESDVQLTEEQARLLVAARKIQIAYSKHRQLVRQKSATHIQTRFRAWQKRREYLRTRQRIVKLQAHVKGHIQRLQYRKMRLAMGVLSKAIIRWRSMRRREGEAGIPLRSRSARLERHHDIPGMHRSMSYAPEAAAAAALERMQAMAESEEAMAQYSRMRQKHESIMGGNVQQ